MRILIVGSDVNAYSIAKSMSLNENIDIIFMTSTGCEVDYAQKVDIPETDVSELLDFAIANEISLTIVTSHDAIKNDIAQCFSDSRQPVFAPCYEAAKPAIYKSVAKKTMYRLKIPTIKFGVFERESQAVEYASSVRKALVVKNDTHIANEFPIFAPTFSKAKNAIERCFSFPDNKVIIEDYIDAKEVSMYFITDGYTALPIGTCSCDDEFAAPLSSYSPDSVISDDFEMKVLRETVYPLLDDLATRSQPYCGILGVDMFVNGDLYNVIEFNTFFKPLHLQSILPLIRTNLYDLFLSSACGSLSDDYQYVKFDKSACYSKLVENFPSEAFEHLHDDNISKVCTENNHLILTQKANTLKRAVSNLEENYEFLKDWTADDV